MAKSHSSILDQHQQRFIRLIRENSTHHRLHEVFVDFCELAAISISNSVDKLHFEKREERYLGIVKRYSREEVDRFPQMLASVTLSLEEAFKDCLGSLFMALELGEHFKGQYFTPYTVSCLMSKMMLGLPERASIEEQGGFITLCEPACGAGGMVIAAAHTLYDEKVNYQKFLHVTATDIDITAAHMCYIQLSLLHIPAIVIHGDSLALTCWDYFVTPAHVLGAWDHRLAARHNARDERRELGVLPGTGPGAAEPIAALTGNSPVTDPGAAIATAREAIVKDRLTKADQLSLF